MQLPSAGNDKFAKGISLWSPAGRPATSGDSLMVSRFLPTREKRNNSITLLRITSAKTRTTAILRQHAHTIDRYVQPY